MLPFMAKEMAFFFIQVVISGANVLLINQTGN